MHGLHHRVALGMDAGLHLHRLDGQQQIARVHRLAHHRADRSHDPRHRRADMVLVARLGLGSVLGGAFDQPVRHPDHAKDLLVELE